MKTLRLRSWNFHAENLDQMAQFYQRALGAEVTAQQTIAGVKVYRLRAGETGLGLFDAGEKRAPGVPHHTFDIEGPNDPQALIAELEGKGIQDRRYAAAWPRSGLFGLRHRSGRQSHRIVQRLEARLTRRDLAGQPARGAEQPRITMTRTDELNTDRQAVAALQ